MPATGNHGGRKFQRIILQLLKIQITPETQPSQLRKDRGAHFTGVCSLDGCSRVPMDGFMAYREMSIPVSDRVAENEGESG